MEAALYVLWFAAIQGIKLKQDLADLAPKSCLYRDSPDELRTTTNFCVFPALGQAGLAAWPAVVTVDAPNGGRGG